MLYKFGLRGGERERINTGNLYFFSSLIPHPSSLVFASRATPGKGNLEPFGVEPERKRLSGTGRIPRLNRTAVGREVQLMKFALVKSP